jgi:hypothetical protein
VLGLLLLLADECRQLQQLQQQVDRLSSFCRGATASAAQAAKEAAQLQEQVRWGLQTMCACKQCFTVELCMQAVLYS